MLMNVPGTVFQGAPLTASWLPLVLQEGTSRGYGPYSIYKIYSGYTVMSGSTHSDGLAVDFIPVSHVYEWVMLFRSRGAAAWARGANYGSPIFQFHIHIQINADDTNQVGYWQIAEAEQGLNGLGNGGSDNMTPSYSGVKAIDGISIMSAPHIPAAVKKGDKMSGFVKLKQDANNPASSAIYLTNGIEAFHVPDVNTLADMHFLAKEGLFPIVDPPAITVDGSVTPIEVVNGVPVRVVGELSLIGKILG